MGNGLIRRVPRSLLGAQVLCRMQGDSDPDTATNGKLGAYAHPESRIRMVSRLFGKWLSV